MVRIVWISGETPKKLVTRAVMEEGKLGQSIHWDFQGKGKDWQDKQFRIG